MSISQRMGAVDWPRFFRYVQKRFDGCWMWIGAIRGNGRNEYGAFWANGTQRAHIVAYVWTYGEPNADLHHTCGNTLCVNPDHLVPASAGQPRHRNPISYLCSKGHELDRVNNRGERYCSICGRERSRIYNDQNREKVNAKKRQRRRDRGEIVHHEPRACDNCGTIYTPKHRGAQRGKYCIDPGRDDLVAYKAYRDCINDRQRRNRQGRERSKGDPGVGS